MARFTKDTAAVAGKKSSRSGVPNKTTQELRERVKLLFEENLEQLRDDLSRMKAVDRAAVLIQLAKFILPRLAAIEVNDQREKDRSITINLTKSEENDRAN